MKTYITLTKDEVTQVILQYFEQIRSEIIEDIQYNITEQSRNSHDFTGVTLKKKEENV